MCSAHLLTAIGVGGAYRACRRWATLFTC